MKQQVRIGDLVYYVLADGQNKGQSRAAVITALGKEPGFVNLTVFYDRGNDRPKHGDWIEGVPYAAVELATPGTWHSSAEGPPPATFDVPEAEPAEPAAPTKTRRARQERQDVSEPAAPVEPATPANAAE